MKITRASRSRSLWLRSMVLGGALTALAGCGGGGDSAPAAPAAPAAPPSLSVTGTAATGAAIAGKTVEAKCATGTGSATTTASGTFTVSVTSGALPCVLRITAADGTVLHSLATGTGSSAVANINPVTHMIIASLAAGDPAAFYAAFSSTTQVRPAAIAAAIALTETTLKSKGLVDLTAFANPFTDALIVGNTYDQALDALKTAMTSGGTTIDQVTQTVVATTGSTPSVPQDLLDVAHASNCAAFRSGKYRMVFPTPGATLADQQGLITVNASTLGVDFGDGSTGTWTANGGCRFLGDNGNTDIVVSPAGVIVARYLEDNGTTKRLAIGVPEQAHTLAQLAGTWNSVGIQANDARTAYTGDTGKLTLDAAGVVSAVTMCRNETTWGVTDADCASETAGVVLKANTTGGFDVADATTGAVEGRVFAYQSGGGELMLLAVDGDGSLEVFTKARVSVPPAVGAVTTSWNLSVGNQLASFAAVTENSNTIDSVDTTAVTWTRIQKTVGGTDDHAETLSGNIPRSGYTFRAAGSALAANGSTVNFNQFTALGLRGMGMSVLVLPGPKLFMFSVQQP